MPKLEEQRRVPREIWLLELGISLELGFWDLVFLKQ
jgi:hypothetical protein